MFWRKKLEKDETMDSDLIVELIVEEFRFLKSYTSLMGKVLKDELPKYLSAYNYHVNKINEILAKKNYKIVELEGKKYDDGLSVNPLNIEDFGKEDILVIDQVLEPLIISSLDGKIIKSGTVMLTKSQEENKCEE